MHALPTRVSGAPDCPLQARSATLRSTPREKLRMAIAGNARRLAAACAAAALFIGPVVAAHGDELRMQDAAPAAATPERGMTMDGVESRYGTPSQKLAPVGDPPITRWEYPSYVVYFEHRHVIHSVARRPVS
jgi:hypothetical protein